mmetsp:Transcript_2940/g.7132  ORF Transcript_2940/g.7132 Transcript_2940/m.7132 type:complete len:258 (+) Transcript_2940:1031-1804(+)
MQQLTCPLLNGLAMQHRGLLEQEMRSMNAMIRTQKQHLSHSTLPCLASILFGQRVKSMEAILEHPLLYPVRLTWSAALSRLEHRSGLQAVDTWAQRAVKNWWLCTSRAIGITALCSWIRQGRDGFRVPRFALTARARCRTPRCLISWCGQGRSHSMRVTIDRPSLCQRAYLAATAEAVGPVPRPRTMHSQMVARSPQTRRLPCAASCGLLHPSTRPAVATFVRRRGKSSSPSIRRAIGIMVSFSTILCGRAGFQRIW